MSEIKAGTPQKRPPRMRSYLVLSNAGYSGSEALAAIRLLAAESGFEGEFYTPGIEAVAIDGVFVRCLTSAADQIARLPQVAAITRAHRNHAQTMLAVSRDLVQNGKLRARA